MSGSQTNINLRSVRRATGEPMSRLEMEMFLRGNLGPHQLRHISNREFNLDRKECFAMLPVSILHYVLDRLVSEGVATGNLLGVIPGADTDEAEVKKFQQRLAEMIQTGQALMPKEGDGVDMSNMNAFTPPPGGAPPQSNGVPQQGQSPQGAFAAPQYPQQGQPPPGLMPQGQPPQGMPPQGMPPMGGPPPGGGFPMQGAPPQGQPQQFVPQGAPPPQMGMPPQGFAGPPPAQPQQQFPQGPPQGFPPPGGAPMGGPSGFPQQPQQLQQPPQMQMQPQPMQQPAGMMPQAHQFNPQGMPQGVPQMPPQGGPPQQAQPPAQDQSKPRGRKKEGAPAPSGPIPGMVGQQLQFPNSSASMQSATPPMDPGQLLNELQALRSQVAELSQRNKLVEMVLGIIFLAPSGGSLSAESYNALMQGGLAGALQFRQFPVPQ